MAGKNRSTKAARQLQEFEPIFPKKSIRKGIRAGVTSEQTRQVSLFILTRRRAQLTRAITKGAESVEAIINLERRLAEYLKWRESDTELLNAAHSRLLIVMQDAHDALGARHGSATGGRQ